MANAEDFKRLQAGASAWNTWRKQNPQHRVDLGGSIVDAYRYGAPLHGANLRGYDLSHANLSWTPLGKADLSGADLSGAMLEGANLPEANLIGANLTEATLRRAMLVQANLRKANLTRADLSEVQLDGANFREANLSGVNLLLARGGGVCFAGADLTEANFDSSSFIGADFSGATLVRACCPGAYFAHAKLVGADLTRANLAEARLIGANLTDATLTEADLNSALLTEANMTNADLTGCRVYGISAWDVTLEGANQRNLVVTRPNEPEITVDNLEVAQFVYLLLHHEKIRHVIDTVGKKGVLLSGRFSGGRLAVLEHLRDELRKRDFLAMVFNFDKPETRHFTETVRLLAGLSRFVIADITNPRSAPLELQATVPNCMIPFATIIEHGEEPFSMFRDLWQQFPNVLAPKSYASINELLNGLDEEIIKPALAKSDELQARKGEELLVVRMGTP